MREINEIWIVHPSGITLFNLSKETNTDATLIGGFFAAIQNFVSEIGESQLKSITLGKSKIMIYHAKDGYLFISRSKINIKEKNISKHLKLVESKFFGMYGEVLEDWNGDNEIFKDFGTIIEDIFKDTPERRVEKALW